MLACVPVSRADLATLLGGTALAGPLVAYAATDALYETLDYTPDQDEEAERAALLFASVASLLQDGRRLVVVADVPAGVPAGPLGECQVPGLAWRQVTAVFADGPDAEAAVEAAAAAAGAVDVDTAWDVPEVQALLAEHDLDWYGPDEAEQIVRLQGQMHPESANEEDR